MEEEITISLREYEDLKSAEEAILDRRVFVLNDKDFDDFDRALSQNKVENNLCLQKALKSKRRWTKK